MGNNHSQFDQYASTYTDLHRANIQSSGEEPSYFAAYKAQYLARHVTDSADLAILDYGCGVGNSIAHLRRAFPAARLYGADPSSESIQEAINAHAGSAEFAVIDGRQLPYESQSFDVVFVACVFHHIPPVDRLHWMGELYRVLRPGGRVFVFEHNMLNPLTVKAVKDCPFDEDAILLPRKEVLQLMENAGLAQACSDYIVFFPRPLAALRPLERYMGWFPLGAQYVVRASA